MKINIIPTLSAEHVAKILEKSGNFYIHYLGKNKDGQRYFPDGEVYVNLDKLNNERTVILFSGAPNPNSDLVELEFILSILKERQINPELFVTYFPYSRQDAIFKEGEINVAETLIKKWIGFYGVKKIYVIDPHFSGKDWTKKYPIENLSAVSIIKKTVLTKYPEISFIAPDAGSARTNNLKGFSKKRSNSYDIEISYDEELKKDIKGKIIGILDDMIGTGGTMVNVCKISRELGAVKLISLVTHGVIESGVEKIKNTYDELFLTNTINRDCANVDISPLITETLNKKNIVDKSC